MKAEKCLNALENVYIKRILTLPVMWTTSVVMDEVKVVSFNKRMVPVMLWFVFVVSLQVR